MRRGYLLLLALLCNCGSSRSDAGSAYGGSGGTNSGGTSPIGDAGDAGDTLEPSSGGAGRDTRGSDGGTESAGASGDSGGAASDAGVGGADLCDPTEAQPAPVHGLALSRIAFFQAVKVPLMEQMLEVTARRAQVVSARPGLLRAYVEPSPGWQAHSVRARLMLTSSSVDDGAPRSFEQAQIVTGESTDATLGSTFNWQVPAELLNEDVKYSVELLETAPCVAAELPAMDTRFPVQGAQPLGVHATTKLRVELVPVELEVGQVSLLPDVSVEQLAAFRNKVVSLFPITDVEISVRGTALQTTSTSLPDILDQVAALRDEENIDPNISYFGVVRFTDSIAQYCNPSCVLGASITGTTPTGGVGVGIGYPGDKAVLTFAHELGHVYGRTHAPCGVSGDASYPYSGGRIGSWGYDVATQTLYDPNAYSDFMGYCSPTWVSDYTYELLRAFIAAMPPLAMNVTTASAIAVGSVSNRARTLLLEAGHAPRWGRSRTLRAAAPGSAERAIFYDAAGAVRGSIIVRRSHVNDLDLDIVYVPEPVAPDWAGIQLDGQLPMPLPHP